MKLFIFVSVVGLLLASQMPFNAIADTRPVCRKYFGQDKPITLEELKKKEREINMDKSLGDYFSPLREAKIKREIHPYIRIAVTTSLRNAKSLDEILEIMRSMRSNNWPRETELSFEELKPHVLSAISNIKLTSESIEKFSGKLYDQLRYIEPGQKFAYFISGEAHRIYRTQSVKTFVTAETKRQAGKQNPYTKGFIYWLAWETVENTTRHQQPIEWIKVKSTQAPLSQVAIHTVDGKELPLNLRNQIIRDSNISWPQHPRNTTTTTPFLEQNGYSESTPLVMHYTASRSMVLDGTTLSLKLPTNNPTEEENDLTKADLRKSVVVSLTRGNQAQRIERTLKPHPRLALLYDVASITDRSTGNGFTVRDLSLLNNGKIWLPTHSINTIGAQIAKKPTLNEARDFWIQNYLKVVANAKAILLLRYGLQMKYPHLQNTLLEFHNNMTPTGRIAVRDLSDTSFVEPIARVVAPKELEEDIENGFRVIQEISPILGDNAANNFMRRNSVGALAGDILQKDINAYKNADEYDGQRLHIHALRELEKVEEGFFIDAVKSELQINRDFEGLKELQDYLFSQEGLNQIKAYHSRVSL